MKANSKNANGTSVTTRKTRHGVYSINSFQCNTRLPREVRKRGQKRQKELGLSSFNDYILRLVQIDTRNVELTAEDYTEIAKEVAHEEELRKNRGL